MESGKSECQGQSIQVDFCEGEGRVAFFSRSVVEGMVVEDVEVWRRYPLAHSWLLRLGFAVAKVNSKWNELVDELQKSIPVDGFTS